MPGERKWLDCVPASVPVSGEPGTPPTGADAVTIQSSTLLGVIDRRFSLRSAANIAAPLSRFSSCSCAAGGTTRAGRSTMEMDW